MTAFEIGAAGALLASMPDEVLQHTMKSSSKAHDQIYRTETAGHVLSKHVIATSSHSQRPAYCSAFN
jgi:hypothetical protein